MGKFEDAYWGKEIAEILQIGDSTLRKWCLSLENQGYIFARGQNNSRAFVERDLLILRRMKDLVQNKGITLEMASEAVITRLEPPEGTASVLEESREGEQPLPSVPSVPSVQLNELLLDILESQERLEQQNKQLISKLEEQQNYINNKLEKRDRQIMEALRETQEAKKLIASSLEQQEQENKKGLFARLFGK
jgi:predicted ribosome quality control (RQC) complex YloA/Tae2 family protein